MADLTGVMWRKSSYSSANGGNCVEVATDAPGIIAVRDSKEPAGPVLAFTPAAWESFAAQVKTGRLDVVAVS